MCAAFRNQDQQIGEPIIRDPRVILNGMKILSIPEPSLYELEDVVNSGKSCTSWADALSNATESTVYRSSDEEQNAIRIPFTCLISGSDRLRQNILKLKTDPLFCALLKTQLIRYISLTNLKILVQTAKEKDVGRIGSVVYNSEAGDKSWFVLLSGKLKATLCCKELEDPEQEEQAELEWTDVAVGSVFGGYNPGDTNHIRVEVSEPSKFLEFMWDDLERLCIEEDRGTDKLLSILGGLYDFLISTTIF